MASQIPQASMKVEPAFRFDLLVDAPLPVGQTPSGNRIFLDVLGGTMKGSGVDATAHKSAGDWAVAGADGYSTLDVRGHFKDQATGDILYVRYYGHLQATPGVMGVLTKADDAKDQPFDSYNHRVAMQIETSSEKLAWVNRTIFVGKGSFHYDAANKETYVLYDVFKVE